MLGAPVGENSPKVFRHGNGKGNVVSYYFEAKIFGVANIFTAQ